MKFCLAAKTRTISWDIIQRWGEAQGTFSWSY